MNMFTGKRMSKKGGLSLSINAIVMLVMAMVVLGLGLGFIRTIFDKGLSNLGDTIDATSLQNPPSATQPVTIERSTIRVKTGGTVPVRIGFYNNGNGELEDVRVGKVDSGTQPFIECMNPKGERKEFDIYAPTVDKVSVGEATGYIAILHGKNNDADAERGTYSCLLTLHDGDDNLVGSLPFILEVTS